MYFPVSSQCSASLQLAEGILRVPPILSAEDLSSPNLDEVSLTTYLSFFLQEGGPGHQVTLDWVKRQLGPENLSNFTVSQMSNLLFKVESICYFFYQFYISYTAVLYAITLLFIACRTKSDQKTCRHIIKLPCCGVYLAWL